MENEMERPTAWEEIGGRAPAATGSQLTQHNGSSLATTSNLPAELQPASLPEFIQSLTPCLQLCAPVGMSVEDRDTWFDAAFMAIGHLPPDILKSSALKAMQIADHPSKIVPAIMKESEDWLALRRGAARYASAPSLTYHSTFHDGLPPIDPEERASVSQTMGELVRKMQANAPTVDDLLGKSKV